MGLFDIFKKNQAVDNQEKIDDVKQDDVTASNDASDQPENDSAEQSAEAGAQNAAEEMASDDVVSDEADAAAVEAVEEANAEAKQDVAEKTEAAEAEVDADVAEKTEAAQAEVDSAAVSADQGTGQSQAQAIAENLQSKDDVQAEVDAEADTEAVIESPVEADEDEAKAEGKDDADEESERAVYEKGLTQSRQGFASRFNKFLANFRSVDEDFFEELEDTLIGSDLGFDLAISISNQVREAVKLENIKDKKEIRDLIIRLMVEQYEEQGQDEDQSMHFAPKGAPTVILFVGVNGVGKTTTVGKMAQRYKDEGKKVMMAAADTFRAGAVKQLQEWGTRVAVPVVAGAEKADPASVVYEAVEKAVAESADVLFVDTAGRLQNNVNLMQELAKMNRVIQKVLPEAPQEVLLVLDATTGQNALQQAKLFQDSSEVTGLVLTKMDGTAKGGIVFAIRDQLHLPVKWVGFGEKVSDLRTFSAEDFVYGMFKDLVE